MHPEGLLFVVCWPTGRRYAFRLFLCLKAAAGCTNRQFGEVKCLADQSKLAGLPGRDRLETELARAVQEARSGVLSALLLMDIDNLSLINSTLGYAAGDETIEKVAGIVQNRLGVNDILFRFHGDELAVLWRGISGSAEALARAESLCQAVFGTEINLDTCRQTVNLTVSIGLTLVDGSLSPLQVLAGASYALLKAKEGGRNQVVMLRDRRPEEGEFSSINFWLQQIKRALQEDRFVLYFQPVVDLKTEKTVHYEALLRLQDEYGHLHTPGHFLAVAERFGLLPQIDRWVFERVCQLLKKGSFNCPVFINLSGVSLSDGALLDLILRAVNGCKAGSGMLGFEITESTAVKDMVRARRWAQQLKAAGCMFALDDFGVGFASFAYLRELPVDYVKIDGSFVRSIQSDAASMAIVDAINNVAHALGKKTVAEFIEEREILLALQSLGVDYGQGHYFVRSTPCLLVWKNDTGLKSVDIFEQLRIWGESGNAQEIYNVLHMHSNPAVREAACLELLRCRVEDAVEKFVALLSSPDAALRNLAVEALQIAGENCLERLEKVLGDPDEDMVILGFNILAGVKNPAAAELVRRFLNRLSKREIVTTANVLAAALEALGQLGERGDVRLLDALRPLLYEQYGHPFLEYIWGRVKRRLCPDCC